jgi:hypothetical protein
LELSAGVGPIKIGWLGVEVESKKRQQLWLFQKNRIPLLELDGMVDRGPSIEENKFV